VARLAAVTGEEPLLPTAVGSWEGQAPEDDALGVGEDMVRVVWLGVAWVGWTKK